MSNKVYLTNEGFLEIEEELNRLKEVKRPEIIKALRMRELWGIYLKMQIMMLLEMNKLK